MTIQFAGVDLLFDNPSGELSRWLDRYLSLEDLRLWGVEPLSRFNANLAIPYPNFSNPPPLRFNQLYWPTGASRWAFGLFIVDQGRLTTILNRIGGTNVRALRNNPKQLVIADSNYSGNKPSDQFARDISGNIRLSTEMFALPPRKIAPNSVVDGNLIPGPWILPLVDVRYYWQWRHTADFDLTDTGDWTDVFSRIESALGLDTGDLVVDGIHADYARPDSEWMHRELSYQNAAVILDAVAASVGKRFVRWVNKTPYVMGPTISIDTFEGNVGFGNTPLTDWEPLCGGEFTDTHEAAVIPEFVTIVFDDPCDGSWQVFEEAATDHGYNNFTAGVKHLIHLAGRDPFVGTSTTRSSEKSSLAFRIAEDFFGWSQRLYDFSFISVKGWRHSGFDDYVIWDFASQDKHGHYRAQTRAASMPYNFGVCRSLALEDTHDFDSCIVEGELLTHITKASDPRDGATTFTMRPFVSSEPISFPETLVEHPESLDGVNRSVDLEAPPGTYLICRWIGRELRPLWVDCRATGSTTTWGP